MMPKEGKLLRPPIIISLGGSLVCPDRPDVHYLHQFKTFCKTITKRHRLIIIVGGGGICRTYQHAAKGFHPSNEDLDWIGIRSTQLNAQFVAAAIGAPHHIINPEDLLPRHAPIAVAAGWKPGCSTDMDAVLLARKAGAHTILNLTNQDAVYTADPKTNPDARALSTLTWKAYLQLVDLQWKPGLSTPFDPIASQEAYRNAMTVFVINGKKLSTVKNAIAGRPFQGTRIHP